MTVRATLYEEDHARLVAERLRAGGFDATVARERFAGEDDDEDHPWTVLTDAPRSWSRCSSRSTTAGSTTPRRRRPHRAAAPRPARGAAPGQGAFPGPLELAAWTNGCCSCTPTPTTRPSARAPRWRRTSRAGTQVTLVTCTLGEEGEVLVPELAHLASDQDDGLGQHRITELANAMKELGVTDHRFLGGAGHFRDSGMAWHEDGHAIAGEDVKEGTFWRADLLAAVRPARRGDPRGPAAGAGDLRPVRRLRAPRPHPGAPRRDVRLDARRRPVLPSRARRALGHREDLLGRDVGVPDARGPAGAARGRRRQRLPGHGPRRPAAAVHRAGPHALRRGGRRRLRRREDPAP